MQTLTKSIEQTIDVITSEKKVLIFLFFVAVIQEHLIDFFL